jgi:predicted nucleic acid-binding protein
VIIVDTSGLVANYNRRDEYRQAVSRVLQREDELILSPFVLAELDYLISTRIGQREALAVLEDIARGAFILEAFTESDIATALGVIRRYGELGIGLSDASIVVLAERYNCLNVLTLDHRHFRAMTSISGAPFRLLPTDED